MKQTLLFLLLTASASFASQASSSGPFSQPEIINSAEDEYFRCGAIKAQHGSNCILNTEFDEYFPVGDPSRSNYGETKTPGTAQPALGMFDRAVRKYANATPYTDGYAGSGLIIYPRAGWTLLKGLYLLSGNAAAGRNPASVTVEGTADGGRTFELIAKDLTVPAFTARMQEQTVCLPGTKAYQGYRVTFPKLAGGPDLEFMKLQLVGTITDRSKPGPFAPLTRDAVWFNRPGNHPEKEGIPVGNGRMGMLLLGGYPKDRIVFNESSLWTGDENPSNDLKTMGAYERFGEVNFSFDNPGQITRYRRALDLKTATATVDYLVHGVHFHREVFSSNPGQVTALRMTADKPGSYSGTLSVKDGHEGKVSLEDHLLVIRGTLPNGEIYESRLAVEAKGGSLEAEGNALRFRNCDGLTLYLAARTDYAMDPAKKFRGTDPHKAVVADIRKAAAKGFDALLAAHVADYSALYDRVAIDLGKSPLARREMPSDLRRLEDKDGLDPEFEALVFQYCRYLLISSTRPGALPANLNGLWCDNGIVCHCDYHSNIDIQECHWPAEVTGIPECHMAFFDLTESQLPYWRKLAKADKEYNAGIPPEKVRGFDIRTSHNIWGGQGWLPDRAANAWYCMHFWEHYAYTQDREFLRNRAWPIMREVSQYWADHLKALPDGRLVVPYGWSPENFVGPCDGTTYQQELVYNVLDHTVQAAKILGIDDEETRNFSVLRDKLLLPAIGSRGQIQEWMADIDSQEIHHRHTSQLIGIYPGERISTEKTPELAQAAIVSLTERGIQGNCEWTLPVRAAIWARLGRGNAAHDLLARFIYDGFLCPNLLADVGSAETDGNGGYVGAVAEMLLQSHRKAEWAGDSAGAPYLIELLPALPEAWHTGSVKGLKARGNFTVDMEWKDGKVVNYRIASPEPQEVKVRVNGETKTIRSQKS